MQVIWIAIRYLWQVWHFEGDHITYWTAFPDRNIIKRQMASSTNKFSKRFKIKKGKLDDTFCKQQGQKVEIWHWQISPWYLTATGERIQFCGFILAKMERWNSLGNVRIKCSVCNCSISLQSPRRYWWIMDQWVNFFLEINFIASVFVTQHV